MFAANMPSLEGLRHATLAETRKLFFGRSLMHDSAVGQEVLEFFHPGDGRRVSPGTVLELGQAFEVFQPCVAYLSFHSGAAFAVGSNL